MLGIHQSPGSFSDRWTEHCLEHDIPFRRVDCLSTDILREVGGLSAVLWHWLFNNATEQLVARQIVASLERRGVLVYPNLASCWHYDDKLGQKYLLEAIAAPLVRTWAFFDRTEAGKWISQSTWPKVFKLRCGAGSTQVRLVRSQAEAIALWHTAFGRGFSGGAGYLNDAGTRLRKTKDFGELLAKIRRAPRSLMETLQFQARAPRQVGYMLFQEFLPNNAFDTRVTVIGERAFGYIRRNRPGDFRASGSGLPEYEPRQIDHRCLEIAFDVSERLGTQSLALDFLFDEDRLPRICEISYCFVASMVHDCHGYWDRRLEWHEGHVWPQDAILQDVLASVTLAPR